MSNLCVAEWLERWPRDAEDPRLSIATGLPQVSWDFYPCYCMLHLNYLFPH